MKPLGISITRGLALGVAITLFLCIPTFAPAGPVAGRAPSYSYRPASPPVYGFKPSGQSFPYQQAGKTMYHTGNRVAGKSSASPTYRMDAFTAPRGGTSRPPVFAPPTYFGGRLWYPK
jgi:hypothetical protein